MKPSLAAAILVAALAAIACGAPPMTGIPAFSPPATPSPVGPPTQALVPWDGFPADQSPRPVVLIGNSSPQDGFSSGEAKTAASCHKFQAGVVLSKTSPGQAQASWGTYVSLYPAISAADALAAMMKPSTATADPLCSSVQPLTVTAARFGGFEFATDRGRAVIYSWLFKVSGANGEMAYPALPSSALWNADLAHGASDGGATLSDRPSALNFTFWGAPSGTGPCGAQYTALVAESRAAVAVAIKAIPNASPGDLVACPAIAQERTVLVTLVSPLAGRVLVNASGAAVRVCPAGSPRGC